MNGAGEVEAVDRQSAQAEAQTRPVSHLANRVLPAIKVAVLLVSIAAAIPTGRNLYYSWLHGIPFAEVPHRLAQYDLWMKNLECKIEYRALLTANGNKVDAGACPKTGDVAIRITGGGRAAYEWIAFDQLQKPAPQTAGILQLLVTPAKAAGVSETTAGNGSAQLAQAGMEVLCQARQGQKVIRIIKDGGKCFREIVAPLKGTIDKSEEVACDKHC